MQIRCPECQFTRHIDESKIPQTAALATCPKCKHKFRFRDFSSPDDFMLEPDPQGAAQQQSYSDPHSAAATKAVNQPEDRIPVPRSGDIWDDIASLGHKKEPAQADTVAESKISDTVAARAEVSEPAPEQHNTYAPQPTVEPTAEPADTTAPIHSPADTTHADSADTTGIITEKSESTPSETIAPEGQQVSESPDYPAYTSTTQEWQETNESAKVSYTDTAKDQHAADKASQDVEHRDASADYREQQHAEDYWHAQRNENNQPEHDAYDGGSRRVVLEEEPYSIPADLQDRLNRPEPEDIPWEWPDRYGFFPSFFETVKRILFSPARFFGSMRPGLTITAPITFYLLTGIVEELATRGWFLTMAHMYRDQIAGTEFVEVFANMVQASTDITMLLMALVMLVTKLILFSGLYQTCLRLVGADKGGFVTTFRVVAYSNAVAILALIPVFGQAVGPIWYLLLTLIGIKHGHRIGWGKAIFAILPVYLLIMIFTVITLRGMMGVLG